MQFKSFTFKSMVASAFFVSVSAFAIPAFACEGHGEETAETAPKAEPKAVTLVGTVSREGCPKEADMKDCTGCVLVLEGDKKYMIVKDATAKKMLKKLKVKSSASARVEIQGEVFEKDGKSLVRVKSYKLVTTA